MTKMVATMHRQDHERAEEQATYQIRALERGLDVLEAFDLEKPELSVADVALATGLPKPTVVRLLSVLLNRRFIERAPDGERYRLGVKTFEIGSTYLQSTSLESEARPIIQQLVIATNQTANLGILDQFEVVHIQVVAPDRPVRFWADIGKREAAHVSGLGKILLSGLDEATFETYLGLPRTAKTANTLLADSELRNVVERARGDGYAMDNEESSIGVCCVAAPIRDRTGAIVAAISISGLHSEFGPDQLPTFIHLVMEAGDAISGRLGFSVPDRTAEMSTANDLA